MGFTVNGKAVTEDEFIAYMVRDGAIQAANALLHRFFIDRDPRWIGKACDSLRRDGIKVPAHWLEAETWARTVRRGRGQPARADQIGKVLRLHAIAAHLWPEMSKYKMRRWLKRESGLSAGNMRQILARYGKAKFPAWIQPSRPILSARFQPRRSVRIL
jgi:hypothetical protein